MSYEPEIRVVQVPSIEIHPRTIERAKEERAKAERLLGQESFAIYEAWEREQMRRVIEGDR